MNEISITMISANTRLEGKISLDDVCRIHGTLIGEVHAAAGSTLILEETGVIEGNVYADTLIINGYIKGQVVSSDKVFVSASGRLIGSVKTPKLKLEPGAFFEGSCSMDQQFAPAPTSDLT